MRRISFVLSALFLSLVGALPSNAASQTFVVTVNGGNSKVEGTVSLGNSTDSASVKVDSVGKATFSLPSGTYRLGMYLTGAFQGVSLNNTVTVTVPGSITIDLPQLSTSTIHLKLPSGSELPTLYSFWESGRTLVTVGANQFATPIAQVVSSVGDGIKIAVYDPSNQGGVTLMQRTLAGSRLVTIPAGQLKDGAEITITDAAFPVFSTAAISGAVGSTYTLLGTIKKEGDAFAGTSAEGTGSITAIVAPSSFVVGSGGCICGAGTVAAGLAKLASNNVVVTMKLTAQMSGQYLLVNPMVGSYVFPSAMIPVETRQPKTSYRSCTALNQDFQGGVYSSLIFKGSPSSLRIQPTSNYKLYNTVKSLDKDKDGIACEVN